MDTRQKVGITLGVGALLAGRALAVFAWLSSLVRASTVPPSPMLHLHRFNSAPP